MENIGRTIHVYWEEDEEWFPGMIDEYHPGKGYHIQYYDGDDEWIKSLNNIKFDDQAQPGASEPEFEPDHESNAVISDDELLDLAVPSTHAHDIRYDSQDQRISYKSSPTYRHDEEDEYTGVESAEEDVEDKDGYFGDTDGYGLHTIREQPGDEDASQTITSEFSSAELSENGLLLKGKITGANNLPCTTSAIDEGVFFRVLYAEGGNQSSMFRCKTPIYKSGLSYEIEFPRWDEGFFRFEMVMPGDMDRSDFTDHGDIIVALYKSRSNGGSEFIGQVSIELQDFVRVGSVGRPRPGAECRFLRGAYVLLDRHGSLVGEGADVDLDIKLEWRPKETNGKGANGVKKKMVATAPSVRSAQTTGTKKSANSTTTGKKSANHSIGKISTTGTAVMSTAAAFQRNKKQKAVDRQNQLLKERIMKAGPKHTPSVKADLYKPVAPESSRQASKPRDVACAVAATPAAAKSREDRSAGGGVTGLSKKSYKDLLVLYDALRDDIATAEKEMFGTRTRVNKMRTQVEKQESALQRKKKQELDSRYRSSPGGARAGSVLSRTGEERSKKSSASGGGLAAAEGTAKGAKEAAASPSRPRVPAVSISSLQNPTRFTCDAILRRAGIDSDIDSIADQLLRESVVEHSALQETRLSLLNRIENAKAKSIETEKKTTRIKKDVDDLILTVKEEMAKPNPDWNLHVQKKSSKVDLLVADVERLKAQKALVAIIGPDQDDISSYMAQISVIDREISSKKEQQDRVTYDGDSWKEQFGVLQEDNDTMKLRKAITLIRNCLLRLRRQERLALIKSETDSIEMEVLRHDYASKLSKA